MDQQQNTPTEKGQSTPATQQASKPILVPQQGEIKNNDHDPGGGNLTHANEAGGKQPDEAR